jgi:phosphohistidine phosphatase SixA
LYKRQRRGYNGKENLIPDVIISSTAIRAHDDTAKAVAKAAAIK